MAALAIDKLLGFSFIKPIIDFEWHTPTEKVAGVSSASDFALYENHCIKPAAMAQASAYVKEHKSSAFLVMQGGKLIHEEYLGRFQNGDFFNSMSMMKSLLALLIGIAIEEGKIASVDIPAAEFLPEWRNDNRREIRIIDLLTMRSGLVSDVSVLSGLLIGAVKLYFSTNLEKTALDFPRVATPGKTFIYNNINSQILGIVLQRATGRRYAEYLAEKLWQPMLARDGAVWLDHPGGMPRTFAGMFARPQDWLRVGLLLANGGLVDGRQVVPRQWVEQMLQVRNDEGNYGLHIWVGPKLAPSCRGIPAFEYYSTKEPFRDPKTFYMEGLRMQNVYYSPEHDLLAVRVGERPLKSWDNTKLFNMLIDGMQ